MLVRVDHTICIGCGTCVVVEPQVFELDKENKSVVKTCAGLADRDRLLISAKSCPVSAIIVSDESGKQIYPELGE